MSEREPKATLAVTDAKLSELARESVEGRPTAQMDPAEMRALMGESVPPIDDLGARKVPDATDAGMRPLTRPPPMGRAPSNAEGTGAPVSRAPSNAEGTGAPASRAASVGDIVVLAREDRKTQKARARELRAARDRAAAETLQTRTSATRTTWMLLAILAAVTIVALVGWLR